MASQRKEPHFPFPRFYDPLSYDRRASLSWSCATVHWHLDKNVTKDNLRNFPLPIMLWSTASVTAGPKMCLVMNKIIIVSKIVSHHTPQPNPVNRIHAALEKNASDIYISLFRRKM